MSRIFEKHTHGMSPPISIAGIEIIFHVDEYNKGVVNKRNSTN